jgi:hypothetical protein
MLPNSDQQPIVSLVLRFSFFCPDAHKQRVY